MKDPIEQFILIYPHIDMLIPMNEEVDSFSVEINQYHNPSLTYAFSPMFSDELKASKWIQKTLLIMFTELNMEEERNKIFDIEL